MLETGTVDGPVPECVSAAGLVRQVPGSPGMVYAVAPDTAAQDLRRPIESMIAQGQAALARISDGLALVQRTYAEAQEALRPPLREYDEPEAINSALEKAVGDCRFELLTAQPGGGRPPEYLADALPRDLALAQRGVRQATLYQHTVRSHEPTLAYIEKVVEHGAEVRTLEEVFERLIICDRAVAFVPGSVERRTSCIAIDHPGLVRYLVKMFEYMWERAQPVAYAASGCRPTLMTDSIRLEVVRLMITGHTDEAIAKRLGMSTRTVSTHIQKVSKSLGGRSRAHLGFLVAQSGLLDEGAAEWTESARFQPHV
ncbi:helix-turn-helix transcriptional regulator [Streptomyces sp. SP17BM10]|uniref:helix-turn-helix transcriptional regulator n=1 Tax=Streptomyces sp. SP17BM10 TaxID=3002530 RepID=UPI002E75B6BF|nr:LuxR C-terminal-related transcriptional regulator [Streptomyces sp. SP17BM10]